MGRRRDLDETEKGIDGRRTIEERKWDTRTLTNCTKLHTRFVYIYLFLVMEVASGEHDVDLIRAARVMTHFKYEPTADASLKNVPVVPALPSPLGKNRYHCLRSFVKSVIPVAS